MGERPAKSPATHASHSLLPWAVVTCNGLVLMFLAVPQQGCSEPSQVTLGRTGRASELRPAPEPQVFLTKKAERVPAPATLNPLLPVQVEMLQKGLAAHVCLITTRAAYVSLQDGGVTPSCEYDSDKRGGLFHLNCSVFLLKWQ